LGGQVFAGDKPTGQRTSGGGKTGKWGAREVAIPRPKKTAHRNFRAAIILGGK